MALTDLFKRAAAVLMLPLSLVPIYLALPRLKAEFGSSDAEIVRAPLPSLPVSFTPAETRSFRPLPLNRNAVPVLAYHGINTHNDVYSVSRPTFASHMEMLYKAGFRTLSIEQYIRFLNGDRKGLPERPMLITFDDGRLDSYRGADKVLARFGFKATMFVIAHSADEGGRFYLNWDDLRAMEKSGRWDIQEHAGDGHHNVRYGKGRKETGPFYAYRRMTDNGLESFDAYKKRVIKDVEWGMERLKDEIPGFAPLSFALPYGNYGQLESNDPRIKGFFSDYLRKRFKAVFVVKPSGYTTRKTPRWRIGRIEIHTYTTAGRLYNQLSERMPSAAGELRVPPLWCRPGWVCRPEQPQPRASGSGTPNPVQIAQATPVPQAGTQTEQVASATPTKGPERQAPQRERQHEAPLTATGIPTNGGE